MNNMLIGFVPYSSTTKRIDAVHQTMMVFDPHDIRMQVATSTTILRLAFTSDILKGFHARLLYDLSRKMVVEELKLFLEKEDVVHMCTALVGYTAEKIAHHEEEHASMGAHWSTGTPYYQWNPAEFVNKLCALYYIDQTFDCSYIVKQSEDKTFEIKAA